MKFIQSYYTDIGTTRKKNQDSLALLKAETNLGEVLMAIVCDGMGGHQAGELASKVCVEKFSHWFKATLPLIYKNLNFENVKREWRRLINDCNRALIEYGIRHGSELGSTLTVFLFVDRKYYVAHVGDSRGYLFHNTAIQITNDHSLIADRIERGLITKEEARNSKEKNMLLECIGITPDTKVDFYCGNIERNATYLLCSDGFWHYLDEQEMHRHLSYCCIKDNKSMRINLTMLAEKVKERGEKDNITAIGIISL